MIEDFTILATYGPLGIICAWFMFRIEKVINNNTKAFSEFCVATSHCRKRKV
jgi:hypothetical protein